MSDKVGTIVFGPAPEHPEIARWWQEQVADLTLTMKAYQEALKERDGAREDRSTLIAENLKLQAERDRLAMTLEAAQAALRDAIASNTANGEALDTARALLMDCWHQLDGDVYVLPGGEVHPGAVTTLHFLHAYLWPEGKTI